MHLLLVPALLLAVANPTMRENDDPVDVVFSLAIAQGKVNGLGRHKVIRADVPFEKDKKKEEEDARTSKIHPLVEKWVASRKPSDVVPLVIVFRQDLKIPRFPEPSTAEALDSPTNKRVLRRNLALIEGIRAKRAADYKRLTKKLKPFGGRVTATFWLIRAVEASMPLRAVRELAKEKEVVYIEPVQTEDEPPQEVDEGRARINSDWYYGLTGGRIAVLDTGIRDTHVQFRNPSHIGVLRDCINGGPLCIVGVNTADDCFNHGTRTAGILTANSRSGAAYRGVSAITVDMFKVYTSTFAGPVCTGTLSTTAAIYGFQGAVYNGNRVIVASMQALGGSDSGISLAADAAFDAGSVVVAPNGNFGPLPSTTMSPASAHRVLGVGSVNAGTGNQPDSQSLGPASDGRTKPDIQAPTGTETASTGCPFKVSCNQSNTALEHYGGTSGAVPYAGAAAALVREFIRSGVGTIEPGYIYAYLINLGPQVAFNSVSGAGPIRMHTSVEAYVGKVGVNDGGTIDIPIEIRGNPANFDGTIWWPEFSGLPHNDIDVYLIAPNGTTRASSAKIKSVFERVRVQSPERGRWILRIRGYEVLVPQTVYFALAME